MHRVVILGAGKIGALISGLLAESGLYQVLLADVDPGAAAGVARSPRAASSPRPRETPAAQKAAGPTQPFSPRLLRCTRVPGNGGRSRDRVHRQ